MTTPKDTPGTSHFLTLALFGCSMQGHQEAVGCKSSDNAAQSFNGFWLSRVALAFCRLGLVPGL